jgi:hypothetical protein
VVRLECVVDELVDRGLAAVVVRVACRLPRLRDAMEPETVG